MFGDWKFKREMPEPIPAGPHRLRIFSAEAQVSKSGNDMLVLTFEVSGDKRVIYHYIVFLPDRPEITNRNLTNFFDSFGIDGDDFNLRSWEGKVGAGIVEQDENGYTRIKRFLNEHQQESLPAWQEPAGGGRKREGGQFEKVETPDDQLPF